MDYQGYLEQAKNERMDAVVDTAAALFLTQGIESVRMTDIAARCGIGVASLYRYFGTKTAIAVAVGIREWNQVGTLFRARLSAEDYPRQSGFDQIRALLALQLVLYRDHKDFLRFLRALDAFLLQEQVPKDALSGYEHSITDLYPYFEQAYRKGLGDGTVRAGLDFPLLYRSLSHALMSVCQRFLAGEILPGDDFSGAEQEISMLIELALSYIQPK